MNVNTSVTILFALNWKYVCLIFTEVSWCWSGWCRWRHQGADWTGPEKTGNFDRVCVCVLGGGGVHVCACICTCLCTCVCACFFDNIHWSGIFLLHCLVVTWLVPCETAAVLVHYVYTIQPFNISCHFMQSHVHMMHVHLAVTSHLHIWRNDFDLLHATVVTWGWNGYWNKSQHRKLILEKKILPVFLPRLKPLTFQSHVQCSNHWTIPAPHSCKTYQLLKYMWHGWGCTSEFTSERGNLLPVMYSLIKNANVYICVSSVFPGPWWPWWPCVFQRLPGCCLWGQTASRILGTMFAWWKGTPSSFAL